LFPIIFVFLLVFCFWPVSTLLGAVTQVFFCFERHLPVFCVGGTAALFFSPFPVVSRGWGGHAGGLRMPADLFFSGPGL